MAQLTHKDFTGNMGSGLHGDVARRAAFDLCRLVEDVSPVKIEACEGGHNLVWKSSEGGRVVIKLSEFMRQRGGQDTQGLESHVVST
ncbi:MAG: hypothetical protein ABH834_04365, partial [Candidatus Altiarchaeota archaeon]